VTRPSCNCLALRAITCCLFAVAGMQAAPAATTYDLKTDWSDQANPNGPWSYRQGSNVLPHVADWQGLAGDFTGVQPAWARAETGNTNLPSWFKIVSPAGIPNDWQFGDIVTHSTDGFNGVGSGPSNVIWTSPLNGRIDISGGVWMGRDIGRGNHWELSLNGTLLSAGDIFSGDSFNRASPFLYTSGSGGPAVLSQVPVVVGDVLQLQITKTSSPGDYAGINLTISAALSGDYNSDNVVDAADYVSLRKQYFDITTGAGLTAYNSWRTNFGRTAGSGAGAQNLAAVPEPATTVLLVAGILAIGCLRREFVPKTH
jgi:hypothetical protein